MQYLSNGIDDSEADKQRRIVYRIDLDAIVIADVFDSAVVVSYGGNS
jgi:hypothetical protein